METLNPEGVSYRNAGALLGPGQGTALAPPHLPVVQGNFEHGLRRFVQPTVFARGQVTADGRNSFAAAEMDVGGLPAHVIEQPLLVAVLGKGLDFKGATVR